MKIVPTIVVLALVQIAVFNIQAAEEEPARLLSEVVTPDKLLPLLPEAPADWTAEKPEGTSDDASGVKITSVHRDYEKGTGDKVLTTSISILDSAANPDYVEATTAAWKESKSTPEGYSKALTIDGMPGFELFENDDKHGKHGALWLIVAKRYVLQIETQGQDAKDLQDWLKRIDVKKLAAVK